MRRIFQLIALTDHRIRSRHILNMVVAAINMALVFMLLAELIYDLQTLDLYLTIFTAAIGIALAIVHLSYSKANVEGMVSNGFCLLIYLSIEAQFINKPHIFPSIAQWLPFVPIVSLITLGLRHARWWVLIVVITHFWNIYYANKQLGESYMMQIETNSYAVSGITLFFVFFTSFSILYKLLSDAYAASERKSEELTQLKNKIEADKKQLENYQLQIINLTRYPSLFEWEIHVFYKHLATIAKNTLQVSRVSVWHLNEDTNCLECQCIVDSDNDSQLMSFCYESAQPYFDAIFKKPYIAAHHARTHEATACFTDSYLIPLDIYSMLDCPIVSEGKPMGVICCEEKKAHRQWQTQDILFIQSLADLVALYHKNQRIKRLLDEIERQNKELIIQANEVETMNEKLNALNEELQTMNETLESRVEERTHQLEMQNKQLREYAFINSHVLRAPLARIRGLLYLMTHDPNATNDWELINLLITEANELDAITTKISDILYDGSNLTREDILRLLSDKEANQSKDIEV